jgi:hypothetical protein
MPVYERPIAPEVGETDRRAGLAAVIIFCAVIAAAAPVQLVYETMPLHAKEAEEEYGLAFKGGLKADCGELRRQISEYRSALRLRIEEVPAVSEEQFAKNLTRLATEFEEDLEALKENVKRDFDDLGPKYAEDSATLLPKLDSFLKGFAEELGSLNGRIIEGLGPFNDVLAKELEQLAGERPKKGNDAGGGGAETDAQVRHDSAMKQVSSRFSRLQELDLFRARKQKPDGTMPSMLEHIEGYEDALAEEAIVAVLSRPYVQWTTRLLLGQGNEKVVIGKDGWLFFRPSILYPTGPGFRTRYVQADATVRDWDPLPAILRFAEDLRARGIELVLVPIPSKAQVYPEKLTSLYDLAAGPPANAYTAEFYRELDKAGVKVIDLAQSLWDAKARGQVYHTLDTHWTPLGMKVFADALAARLKAMYPWLAAPVREYGVEPREIANRGDIFDMLNLPPWSEMYPEYPITVERVMDRTTGQPAEPDPAAEVVLLGDSFTNVMSMAEMNWGDHAGLGEHMMLRLGRPLDVIARNGGAPSATRQDLARRPSLAGRKLVVWSIVTREFITPDSEWKIVPLPEADKAPARGGIEVVAKVLVTSKTPRPRVDPYSEAVTFTKYTVVSVESGEYPESELLAAEWVMRDFELTRAARYKPGDVHRLKLVPLADKEESDASVRQAKTLDDTDDFALAPFWVVEMEEAGDE